MRHRFHVKRLQKSKYNNNRLISTFIFYLHVDSVNLINHFKFNMFVVIIPAADNFIFSLAVGKIANLPDCTHI